MTPTEPTHSEVGNGGVAIFRPHGTMEAQTASRFREEASNFLGAGSLVFDLSDVPFIDSSGLGALIGAIRRTRERGGRAVVCVPRQPVARLLEVVGLDRLVTVCDSLDDALAALEPRAEPAA